MIPQKATILCIYEILKTYSDENHILSAEKIREKLKKLYDIDMERRAIYRNIDALRSIGIEIEGYQENREGYYLVDRLFELSEIRLLCDAVASSEMIEEEAGKQIIRRLIDTQSIFQGRMLQKTLFIKPERNPQSRQLFYTIDILNVAINQGCKVSARLMELGLAHTRTEKENSPIVFSPYAPVWADGYYYVLAEEENTDDISHLRIDLLQDIVLLERGADMLCGGLNPIQYAREFILLKGERKERFEIECSRALWQSLAQAFGEGAEVLREDGGRISVKILAIPSSMRSWVLSHLNSCEVTGPKSFREEIQQIVMEAYQAYTSIQINRSENLY